MDSAQLGRDSVEAYLFVGNLNSLRSDQMRSSHGFSLLC